MQSGDEVGYHRRIGPCRVRQLEQGQQNEQSQPGARQFFLHSNQDDRESGIPGISRIPI
jgi:hypothetical protein